MMRNAAEAWPEDPLMGLRRAWLANGPPPDLRHWLPPPPGEDGVLQELLATDVAGAAHRGLRRDLQYYLDRVPDLPRRPGPLRQLLMSLLDQQSLDEREAWVRETARRHPELEGEVAFLQSFLDAMATPSEDDLPAFRPGDAFGGYELEQILGRGTFGTVWKAWDDNLHRWVALKILHLPAGASDTARDRLLAEARSAARVQHPGVVTIHQADIRDGVAFIDSKLVCAAAPTADDPRAVIVGQPLHRAVTEPGSLEDHRRIAGIVRDAARAVAAAHAQGVIHRDLKPANILLSPGGEVMVADFGLAASPESLAALGEEITGTGESTSLQVLQGRIVGTPAFMSPEQARGETATPLSDVYGLGAVLYTLLSGRPPFRPRSVALAERGADVLDQVRRERPSPLPRPGGRLPTLLAKICRHAMAPDAADRYQSPLLLADDLDAALHGRLTSVEPRTPWSVFRALLRHRPVVVLMIAVALVVLVGGLIALTVALSHERAARSREQEAAHALAAQREKRQVRELEDAQRRFEILGGIILRSDLRIDPAGVLSPILGGWARGIGGPSAEVVLRWLSARWLRGEGQALSLLRPDDGELELLARQLGRIADLALENHEGSLGLYCTLRVLTFRNELLRRHPDELRRRQDASVAMVRVGDAHKVLANTRRMMHWYERALRVDRATLAEHPRMPRALDDLGWCHHRIAAVNLLHGHYEQAEERVAERIRLAEMAVVLDPENQIRWHGLYAAWRLHAWLSQALGNREEARRWARLSLQAAEVRAWLTRGSGAARMDVFRAWVMRFSLSDGRETLVRDTARVRKLREALSALVPGGLAKNLQIGLQFAATIEMSFFTDGPPPTPDNIALVREHVALNERRFEAYGRTEELTYAVPRARLTLARMLRDAGQLEEARQLADSAVAFVDEHQLELRPRVHVLNHYRELGVGSRRIRFDELFRLSRRALIEDDARPSDHHEFVAKLARGMGRPRVALEAYAAQLALLPRDRAWLRVTGLSVPRPSMREAEMRLRMQELVDELER